jgi:hypothetical protein
MKEARLPLRPRVPIEEWASFGSDDWTTLEHLGRLARNLIAKSFGAAPLDAREAMIRNDPTLHP